jgi:hypothetical protein
VPDWGLCRENPPVVSHLVVEGVPKPQRQRQGDSAERLEGNPEPFCNPQHCLPANPNKLTWQSTETPVR